MVMGARHDAVVGSTTSESKCPLEEFNSREQLS
jgi:hypothetical protein